MAGEQFGILFMASIDDHHVFFLSSFLFECMGKLTSLFLQAEVTFLGDLIHPNLVKLIGYCIEDDQRLLVYEFMPRGSLENHLFRSTVLSTSWIT